MPKIFSKCLLCKKPIFSYRCNNRKYCCLNHAFWHRTIKGYTLTKEYLSKLTNIQKSWLSAFWEGEGCLSRGRKYKKYVLSISQNERYVMNYIKKLVPNGRISTLFHGKTKMTKFTISNNGSIRAFIECILPFVHTKKRLVTIKNFLKQIRIKKFKKYV